MKVLRTPEERFAQLPDYPFEPHYVEVDGMRMHYVKEGNNPEEIVLMLHGEPSWSFLYRKMIPIVANAGYTVIAPDLIGFGKSDKPDDQGAYTYQSHMDWLKGFVEALNLENLTLICQDWGGLLGLRFAAENEGRVKRIVTANTMLPTGDVPANEAFQKWKDFSQNVPEFPVGVVIDKATVSEISKEVIAAYNAPFPDESYKAAVRKFPMLVPVTPDDPAAEPNRKAWQALKKWDKPFLTAFSDSDPIMRGNDDLFQKLIPGTKGQAHTIIEAGGHFLQEDKGEEFAKIIVNFIQQNP
ncbi:MAG: haloalkane dehalogenase [Bacteroidota bacterium]